MAISFCLFESEFSVLAARFNSQVGETVIARYYKALSCLSEQEFLVACERVFDDEDFLPSPKRFIEKVRSADGMGLNAWAEILRAIPTGKEPPMSEIAEKAIATIGGFKAVKECNIQTQLPHFRRDFLSAFETYSQVLGAYRLALPDAPKTRDEVLKLIGVELRSLNMTGALPIDWQIDKATTASELPEFAAHDYLEWLRSQSNAIVPI